MPTGPPLVTKAELAAFLDVAEADLPGSADLVLELASDNVRDYLGQRVDYVEDAVEEVLGQGTDVLLLPELPVLEVTTVTIPPDAGEDEEALTTEAGDWRLELGREGRFAVLRRLGGAVWPKRPIAVTYSHGYELAGSGDTGRIPGTIRLVVLRQCARDATNPGDIKQETVGRYSVTFGGSPTLTELDRTTLGRYLPGSKAGAV